MNLFFPRSAAVVAVFSLVAFGLPVAPVGVAHAAGVTQTLNVAVLTPCCGNPQPSASGVAQSNSLSKTGVGQADIFSASITIPGSSSAASHSSADIHVVLSRQGQDYAECLLVPVHHHSSPQSGSATFQVAIVKVVVQSGTVFRQFAGWCDVDLSTGGIQAGVPAVQTGDVATAVSIVNSIPTEFLSGIFVQP